MLKKMCCGFILLTIFHFAMASVFINLNVPNGQSPEAKPYYDHTYIYYIYCAKGSPTRCEPPSGINLFRLGEYYENDLGNFKRIGFLEYVTDYIGESNCVYLVAISGRPGLMAAKIDGNYISKTPFLLSDLGSSVSFPYDFKKI